MPSSSTARRTFADLWNGPADLPRKLKLERRLVLGRWLAIAFFAPALALYHLPPDQERAAIRPAGRGVRLQPDPLLADQKALPPGRRWLVAHLRRWHALRGADRHRRRLRVALLRHPVRDRYLGRHAPGLRARHGPGDADCPRRRHRHAPQRPIARHGVHDPLGRAVPHRAADQLPVRGGAQDRSRPRRTPQPVGDAQRGARAPRIPRPVDRPAQSQPALRVHGTGHRGQPATTRWRCSSSTSTASRKSTTPSATTTATCCCSEIGPAAARGARRRATCIARLGGDEFAVLLADAPTRPRPPNASPRRCSPRSSEPFEIDDYSVDVGASIGIALCPDTATTPTPCSSAPTSPCTSPSARIAASRSTRPSSTSTAPIAWRWSASCAEPSTTTSSSSTTSPRSTWDRRAHRRRGAGPLAAPAARPDPARPSSSRSPSKPASSGRSAAGSSTTALRQARDVARRRLGPSGRGQPVDARPARSRAAAIRSPTAARRGTACRPRCSMLEITESGLMADPARRCGPSAGAARAWAFASRSTTSAPATRRWATSSGCPSTS